MIQDVVERKPVRTISMAELRDKLARHEPLKLVMTLNEWAYRAKRIPRRCTSTPRPRCSLP